MPAVSEIGMHFLLSGERSISRPSVAFQAFNHYCALLLQKIFIPTGLNISGGFGCQSQMYGGESFNFLNHVEVTPLGLHILSWALHIGRVCAKHIWLVSLSFTLICMRQIYPNFAGKEIGLKTLSSSCGVLWLLSCEANIQIQVCLPPEPKCSSITLECLVLKKSTRALALKLVSPQTVTGP